MMRIEITVDRTRFVIKTDSRTDTSCVDRIAPYDEQEYSWARFNAFKSTSFRCWDIFRNGKLVDTLIVQGVAPESIEEYTVVAEHLLMRDADLKPIRAIW